MPGGSLAPATSLHLRVESMHSVSASSSQNSTQREVLSSRRKQAEPFAQSVERVHLSPGWRLPGGRHAVQSVEPGSG